MKKAKYLLLAVSFIYICTAASLSAQNAQINFNEKIKNDPSVIKGKLKNGLTYYIKANKKPEKRAELRLAVNAGSILEDDNQQGLAHFCEHMGFRGTKHFKKQELVDFLESIGMSFGPEVNAFTSFDETVYMIQIPTDKQDILEKGLLVLRDWAGDANFENEDIDKERGVIVEEWRLGRGAEARIQDKQLPVMLKNSHYAERIPIGKKEIIESFKYDTLKKFYKDWYRPDLMAVIITGDVDPKQMEQLIIKKFSDIKPASKPRKRNLFDVPPHKETLCTIESDKELGSSSAEIMYKYNTYLTLTLGDAKKDAINEIACSILNERLFEKSREANAPFVSASAFEGRLVRKTSAFGIDVTPKENNIESGIKAAMLELEKVRKFGFTQTELDRAKSQVLREKEQAFKEQDKTESGMLINYYVNNFLYGESYPDFEESYNMSKQILPTITLKDLADYITERTAEQNKVISISLPEKDGIVKPLKENITKLFEEIKKEKIEAYVDKTINEDLIPYEIVPGKIVEEKKIDKYGITELKLSNGARVILKPTDFKNDEIVFKSFSKGGASLGSQDDFYTYVLGASAISQCGIGKFDNTQLKKYLTGKIVHVSPTININGESISGSASIKNIDDMFKMVYLCFTSPRKDDDAIKAFTQSMRTTLQSIKAMPEYAAGDTLSVTTYNYHKLSKPLDVDVIDKIDFNKALDFYKERFADASGFTFVFVGSFDINKIKPMIEKYIGGLPFLNRNENFKDSGMRYAKGKIEKEIKKGIEPKGYVVLRYTGDAKWSTQEAYYLNAMIEALQIKLREAIREEKSGTYGVSGVGSLNYYPVGSYQIDIEFGCDPAREKELAAAVVAQIDSLCNYGFKPVYVDKVKETHKKTREKELKENNSWLNWISRSYSLDIPLNEIDEYNDWVNSLTPELMQAVAKKYFNKDNCIKIFLQPEK